mgnify:CR=1 FL=1
MLNVAIKAARAAGALINRAALDVESDYIHHRVLPLSLVYPSVFGRAGYPQRHDTRHIGVRTCIPRFMGFGRDGGLGPRKN